MEYALFAICIVFILGIKLIRDFFKINREYKYQTAYMDEMLENSMDGILILDRQDKIIKANEAFERLFQYSSDEIHGSYVNDIIASPEIADAFEISEIILRGGTASKETKRKRKDGSLIDVNVTAFPVVMKKNQIGLCAIYSDISSKKEAERELELQRDCFTQLFQNSPEAICMLDNEDRFMDVNSAFEKQFGYEKGELINKYVNDMIVRQELLNEAAAISNSAMTGSIVEKETIRWRKDGSPIEVCILAYPIFFQNNQIGIYGIYRDINERKRFEQRLKFLSYHDQLTGLYNRRFFEEQLDLMDKEENYPLTIFMADVNGLKLVNDSFGHLIGDKLLTGLASVLRRSCRADYTIARLGGDEFVIAAPKTDDEIIRKTAELILSEAAREKTGSIDLSISLGYETKYTAGENLLEIFKKAEDHMYKNKLFESPSTRAKTINTIICTLHEKNKREEQHSHRVSLICEVMGRTIGLSGEEIKELKTVGLLHDIGKIAIEDKILNKPGKLTDAEYDELKRHSEIGYRILGTVHNMSEMAEYVLYHHERWDGNGYPKGISRYDIPLQSRIISIADAFDAMTSDRSYRNAFSRSVAIEEIIRNAGTQFDPELAVIFAEQAVNKLK